MSKLLINIRRSPAIFRTILKLPISPSVSSPARMPHFSHKIELSSSYCGLVISKNTKSAADPNSLISRSYAKRAKDTKKEAQKKATKPSVELSHEEQTEIVDLDQMKKQMEMTLAHLQKEYTEKLALRVSLGAINSIEVETTAGKFPLNQLGTVYQKTPQMMMINLVESPQHIDSVKMAITKSGVNINPQQEGTTLFLPLPKITREYREGLAKNAKLLCEKTKEKLRNIQNNYDRELKKSRDKVSEDLIRNLHELILATTKDYGEKAEDIMESKQKEIMNS